jgi:pilus assembly protein CpaB
MKKMRRRLFILAIIFALLSASGIYLYLKSLDDRPVVEERQTYTILVAATDIPARVVVDENMIKEVVVNFNPSSEMFFNAREDIIGKYVMSKIYRDSQFHIENLDTTLKDDLSLKLRGNMRAVSLGVSGNAGGANLIKPGDRVDIVVFLPQLSEKQFVVRPDIVKVIMQNVEVLAIDQDLTTEVNELADGKAIENNSAKVFIATLAVPIYDVETLIMAKATGSIDLVLRPLEGDFIYATRGAIWQDLLLDDFDRILDMFPNYEVESVGETYIDPNEFKYDKYVYYTVSFGDTLREISLLFYGTEENYLLLQQVNNIDDEDVISAGMGLKVPVLDN